MENNYNIKTNFKNDYTNTVNNFLKDKNFNNTNYSNDFKKMNDSKELFEKINNINKIPKNYTNCVQNLKDEYEGKLNPITSMDMRGYCVAKQFFNTVPYAGNVVDSLAKSGLDAYVNSYQNVETFDFLKKTDKYLDSIEKKNHNKTLFNMIGENSISANNTKSSNFMLDYNNKCLLDRDYDKNSFSDLLNSNCNKNIDSYTSFKDAFNKEFKSPF